MSRILFDYACPAGHKFEELVDTSDPSPVNCPTCHTESTRQLSAPRIDPKMGIHADSFPTMGDKWAETRRQRRKILDKKAAEHGTDVYGNPR